MTLWQFLKWVFWQQWTPRVRRAYKLCREDKGHLSAYDLDQIRWSLANPDKSPYWAMRACGHARRRRSNNGISVCRDCDKVFVAKPSRLKYLASLVGW